MLRLGLLLSLHVRPGASVLYVRVTRASLLRAVRTGSSGQRVPYGTYTVRVPASGVPHVPRTVAPQVTDMLHASAPLLRAELDWRDTGLLQRKVNRQAGCDAQQMYGNDSAVAEGLRHAYSLDLELYAHARMLFCRALAAATRSSQSA